MPIFNQTEKFLRGLPSTIYYQVTKRRKDITCDYPVFILGCGRSGTTIIGNSLGRHPDICYLNEPRHLWSEAYPVTDIWSKKASQRKGKMILTKEHCENKYSQQIHSLFGNKLKRSGKRVLLEKTPINNFRTDFLSNIFPNAKYIFIYRNGIEVATSIEKAANKGSWFGSEDYKWKELVQRATSVNELSKLQDFPKNNFERGLLEWRLSTEAVTQFLKNIPTEKYEQVTYSDFVTNPKKVISELLNFMGLESNHEIDLFLESSIRRRSKASESATLC